MYDAAKDDEALKPYLPDYHKNQVPAKEFLFNIINTIYPGRMEKMIKEVKLKKLQEKEKKKLNDLVMTKDYYDKLSTFTPVYEPPSRNKRKFLGLIR